MSIVLNTGHKLVFPYGAIVYLVTDIDQRPFVVTGHMLRPNKTVLYEVCSGLSKEYLCMEVELSEDKIIF